jgi:hypothetical protein
MSSIEFLTLLAFAKPTVALPSGTTLDKAHAVNVHTICTRVDAFVGACTAIRCRREPARCSQLVWAMRIETRAVSGEGAHVIYSCAVRRTARRTESMHAETGKSRVATHPTLEKASSDVDTSRAVASLVQRGPEEYHR